MSSRTINAESRSLASSSDFVVVNRIPTKLLRYGILDRDLGTAPAAQYHSSILKEGCRLGSMIKSKTTSSLLDAGGHRQTTLPSNTDSDSVENSQCSQQSNEPTQSSRPTASSARVTATTKLTNILILVIPGNPGIIDYYEVFLQSLYVRLNQIVPVWGVSHAGHVTPPQIYAHLFDELSDKKSSDMYNLEGQICHKLEFIKRYIPKSTRLILVGHSIGAYIVLELMDRLKSSHSHAHANIIKGILLFPTIERMSNSPQGSMVKPLCQLRWLVLPPQYALYYAPTFIKRKIIAWYFGNKSVPECAFRASLELFNPTCCQNILYLANDELNTVTRLNSDVISDNLHSLVFIYGKCDPWCPVRYYEDMKAQFPSGHIYICDDDRLEHAFVLQSSVQVANLVYQWICTTVL